MSVNQKGVSPEAAETPVGRPAPDEPTVEVCQALYLRMRTLWRQGRKPESRTAAEESLWEWLDDLYSAGVYLALPYGKRHTLPDINPHHLNATAFLDTCVYCNRETVPCVPAKLHYLDRNNVDAKNLYHIACWEKFYEEHKAAGTLDSLGLWGVEKIPPKAAAPKKRKAKAAGAQKPTRNKAAVRHRVVPSDDIDEKFRKVPREITRAFLLTPELKVDFGVPSTGVKAEVDRILAHKLARVFATKHHCRDGTIRGTYSVMRQEYLASLIAKGRAHEVAPKPIVKPPVETSETGPRPSWMHNAWNWLQGKDDGSPSIH